MSYFTFPTPNSGRLTEKGDLRIYLLWRYCCGHIRLQLGPDMELA